MLINFQNVEELIFFNRDIQEELPEFKSMFEQWAIGIKSPLFKKVANKAKLELLNSLTHEHVLILEKYLKEQVFVAHLNYKITQDYTCEVKDLECFLWDYDGFDDNYNISREGDTCW